MKFFITLSTFYFYIISFVDNNSGITIKNPIIIEPHHLGDLSDLISKQTKDDNYVKTTSCHYIKTSQDIRALHSYNSAWYGIPHVKEGTGVTNVLMSDDVQLILKLLPDHAAKIRSLFAIIKYVLFENYGITKWQNFVNLVVREFPESIKNGKKEIIWENSALTLLYRYSMCLQNLSTYLNCPHPCNALPCNQIEHAKQLSCELVMRSKEEFNPDIAQDLFKQPIADLFRRDYKCTCNEGFKWLQDNKKCVIDQSTCEKFNHCNGQHCEILNNTNSLRSFKCNF